ncbi:MAG: class II fumarate hydratase, partial [Candidatus Zixiibacteriota bacterium]
MAEYRTEIDTLGEVKVPQNAYYGAQTQRAVENFRVSGIRFQPEFIRAQAIIKLAAARANMDGGVLDKNPGKAIIRAAKEIMEGRLADQFVLDVFQAGAGTSQNMNVNEVIANRANEILGGKPGEYRPVHPNDHVNMGQSTNDTIHTAIHISGVLDTYEKLLPSLCALEEEFRLKAEQFDHIVKCGRTHLQDAVPIRLGQEFSAYRQMLKNAKKRISQGLDSLKELSIGGSAVGTGLNTTAGYRECVIKYINEATEGDFRIPENMFEAMTSLDAVVEFSGVLRVLATGLKKIADDIRLLGSGPLVGLRELRLPAVQPGSSIMPGKVNPVMAEMLNMVCCHAFGCDTTILHAAHGGQLDLNVMMPVVGYTLLLEINILTGGMNAFRERCIEGLEADEKVCREYAERSTALATALNPLIGYHRAAELAQQAYREGKTIRALAEEL